MPLHTHNDLDQVVITDRWSRYLWQRCLETQPNAAHVMARGEAKIYSFPRFGREVFHRLYSDHAQQLHPIKPEDQWAQTAHDELVGLPDFDRLKRRCCGDRLYAGTAATAFAETVLNRLPEPPQPIRDPEPLRDQVRGLLAFAKTIASNDDAAVSKTEVSQLTENLRHQGKAAVADAVRYATSIDRSQLRQAMRAACDAANTAVEETVTQLSAFCSWGKTPNDHEQLVGIDLKAELAARIRNSAKLTALAKEVGRLRRIAANKQRSKADQARNEVTDIERGNELSRLLPSELVKLTHPLRIREFARGFLERSLLQYKLGGKEPQGRGPIVVCVDQSSSMEGAKEIWSKALALALLQVATMQKRACCVVHFNNAVARVDDWRPGKVDPVLLLNSMEPFYGGGTSLEPPLTKALEAIESEPTLRRADVVLLTDGEGELSESFIAKWRTARQRFEIAVYAIHVDSPGGVAPWQLGKVADHVIGLNDVAVDLDAVDIVLNI